MTVNFRMDVNSPGSQLCLDFSRYFSDPQAGLCDGVFKNRKSTLPFSTHGVGEKKARSGLLLNVNPTQMKTNFPG